MDEVALLVTQDGPIVRLTLNRPAIGNAINREMGESLLREAIRCDRDNSVRCVVISGAGKMFCSGGDIGNFASSGEALSTAISSGTSILNQALSKLARMAKPLLVLVNGPVAGAGLGLALAGDVVIASRSASFTAGYNAIGMTPDGGVTWLLPKLIGLRRTQEMILTNRRIDAVEAAAIGLVTRVVDDEQLTAEGESTASSLSLAATDALGVARGLLMQGFGNGLEVQMEIEARAISAACASPHAQEGFAAFLERRKPVFSVA
jgi:2-(1,2-epoxy-1,2-dihydrophenyl)acetyl-CoA isomerase